MSGGVVQGGVVPGGVVPGWMSDRAGAAATYAADGMPGGGMWGTTGITRMFEAAQGGQIAWLIPGALVLLVLGIVLRGRMTRTDPTRAALIVWGGWLLVTGLTFSFMAGIFHAYYTVALAPAVAALVGGGSVLAWRNRDLLWVRLVGAATLLLTGATAWVLLSRSPEFVPWLRWVVVVAALVAACLFVVPVLSRRVAAVAVGAALLAGLGGPVAYAAQTISTPHTGSIVSAGPNVEFGRGGRWYARRRQWRGGTQDGAAQNGTDGMGTAQPGGPAGGGGMTSPGSATAPDGGAGGGHSVASADPAACPMVRPFPVAEYPATYPMVRPFSAAPGPAASADPAACSTAASRARN